MTMKMFGGRDCESLLSMGKSLDIYKETVKKVLEGIGSKAFMMTMPSPRGLVNTIDSARFNRMTVAYELTYDAENIGEIMKPSNIPLYRKHRITPIPTEKGRIAMNFIRNKPLGGIQLYIPT